MHSCACSSFHVMSGLLSTTRTVLILQLKMFYQTNRTQAPGITPRQRRNGPVCCCVTSFAASAFHSVAAGGDWSARRVFVPGDLDHRPLTLAFKLPQARDQTRLPSEFGANSFNGSRDIDSQTKKYKNVTNSAKTESYFCGVIITSASRHAGSNAQFPQQSPVVYEERVKPVGDFPVLKSLL